MNKEKGDNFKENFVFFFFRLKESGDKTKTNWHYKSTAVSVEGWVEGFGRRLYGRLVGKAKALESLPSMKNNGQLL